MRQNAFRLIGLAGWVAAAAVVAPLADRVGLPVRMVALLAPLGLGWLVVAAYLRQLVTGQDRLVLIEDATTAGALLLGVCALLGQRALGWADLIAIGLAVFAGVGRIGCLVAGCCHGRPARLGIAYRQPAPAGPPVGLPLVPVQAVESAGLLTLAAAAASQVAAAPAGTAFGGILLGYGLMRSATELARGDRGPGGTGGGRRLATAARIEAGVLALVGAVTLALTR